MGRPTTKRLDRDRIARAALALLDRNGDFGVTDVARRLDVQVSSLYHHVSGREDIIGLVRDRIVTEIDTSTLDDRPWEDALAAWARSYRGAFARHPAAIKLLATHVIASPGTLGMYERAVGVLEREGFTADRIVPAITAIESFVLGSALDLAAPPIMFEAADEMAPRLAQLLRDPTPDNSARADIAFELGLEAIIAGLEP